MNFTDNDLNFNFTDIVDDISDEEEPAENETKKPINENYRKYSVNVIQEMTSVKFKEKYPKYKFVGKTNKNNLVFEHNNKTVRITPKGDII